MWILNNTHCGNIDFSVCVQKVIQEKRSMWKTIDNIENYFSKLGWVGTLSK